MNDDSKKFEQINFESEDPLLKEAIKIIAMKQEASATLLQRKFSIGYTRAARLIEAMEKYGVIGTLPPKGSRRIYIDTELYELAFHEKLEPQIERRLPLFTGLYVTQREMQQILNGNERVHIHFNNMMTYLLKVGQIFNLVYGNKVRLNAKALNKTVVKRLEDFSPEILAKSGYDGMSLSEIYQSMSDFYFTHEGADEFVAIEFELVDSINIE